MASKKHLSAEGRQDFMKRFYAVAVSVGFASKIGDLKFLSDFAVPSYQQLHQLILLIFAMVVVVGSWDAYFQSIKEKPLTDLRRFALDVFIIFLYILLLLSVKIRMFSCST